MKRVLIIDDEETIQAVVQFGLRLVMGWEVLTASSGTEGLRMAQAEQLDVILLDVVMPEMDGMATLKLLQSNCATQHIPVILLTAKAQTAETDQFRNLGASGVITKPFNSLALPEQIAEILHWDV